MDIIKIAEERRLFWLGLSPRWKMTRWIIGILGILVSDVAAATIVSGNGAPYF